MIPNFYNQVQETAKEAIRNGNTISVNYALPQVHIDTNFNEFIFLDHEAEALINSAEDSDLRAYCTVEQILLWQAQNW